MGRPWAHRRSLDRVIRLCEQPRDDRSLRLAVLGEIRRAVGFDAYAWLLTDPATWVGTGPLADVPRLPELPRLIRLKYLSRVNRWTQLDGVQVAHLPDVSLAGDDWPGYLAGCGMGDVASAVFADRYGCWGWLDLWRARQTGRFTQRELALLSDILEPVTTALRRAHAGTFMPGQPGRARPPGPVVLVLSPGLEVLTLTPQAHEYLRILLPGGRRQAPVPANAYNVAAQLLAVEAGVDDHPAMSRAHLSDGLWVTMRAARLEADLPPAKREIAVTIEESSPSERVALFARCFGFSQRETQVLGHLTTGSATREMAHRMFLSENTVQEYLTSIFDKTSTRSRAAVLSRALGT